jgi:hypothetical protein
MNETRAPPEVKVAVSPLESVRAFSTLPGISLLLLPPDAISETSPPPALPFSHYIFFIRAASGADANPRRGGNGC